MALQTIKLFQQGFSFPLSIEFTVFSLSLESGPSLENERGESVRKHSQVEHWLALVPPLPLGPLRVASEAGRNETRA